MTSVDTNVLVRLLTVDDPVQAVAAESLFAGGLIWIAKTVLLETSWVLRSFFGFNEIAVREAFTRVLSLENVHIEDESSVTAAFELMTHGVAFADAMHLSSRPPGALFVSFDKSFVRRAKQSGVLRISGLPVEQ